MGLLYTGSKCLLLRRVKGSNLEPVPPARIMPRMLSPLNLCFLQQRPPPFLVLFVPINSFLQFFLNARCWLKSKLVHFVKIKAIAPVMPWPVLHIFNHFISFSKFFKHHFCYFNIRLL